MDIKVAGITPEIMEQALAQAKDGRMHILGEMAKAISGPQAFSAHAPQHRDHDSARPTRSAK